MGILPIAFPPGNGGDSTVTKPSMGIIPRTAPSRLPRSCVTGLPLVRVGRIAAIQIGQRHRERAVLHLPDVAELVGYKLLLLEKRRRAQQDRQPRRVAVEPPEPRQPEEPRHDPDAHAAQRHRARVQRREIELRLRTDERVSLRLLHENDASVPPVKRRFLRVLARTGLLGPAFRTYERVVSLRPGQPAPAAGPPLPPRRLMVRVAGTADAEWFLRSGRAA